MIIPPTSAGVPLTCSFDRQPILSRSQESPVAAKACIQTGVGPALRCQQKKKLTKILIQDERYLVVGEIDPTRCFGERRDWLAHEKRRLTAASFPRCSRIPSGIMMSLTRNCAKSRGSGSRKKTKQRQEEKKHTTHNRHVCTGMAERIKGHAAHCRKSFSDIPIDAREGTPAEKERGCVSGSSLDLLHL